jgi:metal-responsive CopG/Arc/MetJ family transcriptional regulator
MTVGTTHSRIQVTVSDELAEALQSIDRAGRSRSKLMHDLALRGAQEERRTLEERREAVGHLKRIASGEDDGFDFDVVRELHAAR